MKTKKVRPVLVEIKFNSIEEMQGDIILRNDKIYTCEQLNILQLHKKESNDKVFELILLSLEDEEIKIGEIGLDLRDNTLFEVKRILTNHYESGILSFQKSYCKKVIARQSQIPLEYISKFIEQYNKGYVEDLEIEMITINEGYNDIADIPYQEVDIIKLTNGFVTIVEKPIYQQIIDTVGGEEAFCKLTGIIKEPILYTEEEVKHLCLCAMSDAQDNIRQYPHEYIDEWFEQNKKNNQ